MAAYCLLSWGANSHGQLGLGMSSEQCVIPEKVDLSFCTLKAENIRKIVGGAGHTIILDKHGRLFSCGWNNKGQTGFTNTRENVLYFKEIMLPKIVDVTCGWDSSAALSQDGDLFVWGSNRYGQLGISSSKYDFLSHPTHITLPHRIKRISMGLRHTALLNQDGEVLVSGADNKGQLGLNNSKTKSRVSKFTRIPELYAQDISCGQHHTVVSTEDEQLYSFGDNKYGQLGLNMQRVSNTPYPLKIKEIVINSPIKIHTGWCNTSIFTVGNIINWGRNNYGQLGCHESSRPAFWKPEYMRNMPKIKQIALGSEHTIALTEDGTILAWGWNEHGNCGNGCIGNVTIPDKTVIPSNYVGTLVGSGAGHSFAVIRKDN